VPEETMMRISLLSCVALAAGCLPASGCASSFPKAFSAINVDGSNPGGKNISSDKRRSKGPGLISRDKDGFVIIGGDLGPGKGNPDKPVKVRR